ncbi:MAG: SAM-dependent methyltransferase [Pseudomonadota bacterium]
MNAAAAEPKLPLEKILREQIAHEGSISIADYMALALSHPQHGYYVTRDPFGQGGDFTTSPEISQLFGEMFGAFIAAEWMAMEKPSALNVVECGAGRGTLMRDACRVFEIVPDLIQSLHLHLIEISPKLRDVQKLSLQGRKVTWHDNLDSVPDGPFALIANEFLDALPIEQFVYEGGQWRERRIGLQNGTLTFVSGDVADIHVIANEGNIFEKSPAREGFMRDVAIRCMKRKGFAVFVDYGHVRSGIGDTLQAVRGHEYFDVLRNPGSADLTSHVDFSVLKKIADTQGCDVYGPAGQGSFLKSCGITERAALLAQKNPAADVASALHRLTSPDEMGELFKVMIIASPEVPFVLQAFE